MDKIEKKLYIPKDIIEKYDELLERDEINYEEEDIPRSSIVAFWTVDFGNGYVVRLNVCSADDDEPLWSEAVLFLNGVECCCTEPDYSLSGEYWFEYDGKKFTLAVKPE